MKKLIQNALFSLEIINKIFNTQPKLKFASFYIGFFVFRVLEPIFQCHSPTLTRWDGAYRSNNVAHVKCFSIET